MKTRVTELFGIEQPVIQGAMAWVANANLAAGVSAAGGLGIVAAGAAVLQREPKRIDDVNYETGSKHESAENRIPVSTEETAHGIVPFGREQCHGVHQHMEGYE